MTTSIINNQSINEGDVNMTTLNREYVTKAIEGGIRLGTYSEGLNEIVDRQRKDMNTKNRCKYIKAKISNSDKQIFIDEVSMGALHEELQLEEYQEHRRLSVVVKPYAKNLLSITCKDDKENLHLMSVTQVFVKFDMMNVKPLDLLTKTEKGYISLITSKEYFHDDAHVYAVVAYEVLIFSPGGAREFTMLCHKGSEEERLAVLNDANGGLLDYLLVDANDKEKANKTIIRLANGVAGSVNKGHVPMAYLAKAFPSSADLEMNPYTGKPYSNGLDGMGYLNAAVIAPSFNLTEMQLAGNGAQARNKAVITKIFGVYKNKRSFVRLLKKLQKTGMLYIEEGYSLEEIGILVDTNAAKITDAMDMNNNTMTFSLKPGIDNSLRLLDSPKYNAVHTSLQMIEKIVKACSIDGMSLIKELFLESINESIHGLLSKEEGQYPQIGEVIREVENHNILSLLTKIAPKSIYKDRALFKATVNQVVDKLSRIVNKFSAEIHDSSFFRLIADDSYMQLGVSILKYGEFYANVEEGYDEMVAFKAPTEGNREYYYGVRVTKEELTNRLIDLVMKGEINLDDAIEYARDMTELNKSILVLPEKNIIKAQNAGLDFDYDGMSVFFDKRIIALMRNYIESEKQLAVRIVDIPKKNPKLNIDKKEVALLNKLKIKSLSTTANAIEKKITKITSQMIREAWLTQVMSDGQSIGQISNLNTLEVQILLTIEYCEKAIAGQLDENTVINNLEDFDNNKMIEHYKSMLSETLTFAKDMIMSAANLKYSGKKDYRGLSIIDEGNEWVEIHLTNKDIDNMLSEIAVADLDNINNIKKILEDLNVLRRMQQEGTIDSAKTALLVRVDMWPSQVKAKCLVATSIELREDLTAIVKRGSAKQGVRLFGGIFTELQEYLCSVIQLYFKNEIATAFATVGFSDEDTVEFTKVRTAYKTEFNLLTKIKAMYNTISTAGIQELNDIVEDEEIRKKAIDTLNSKYDVLAGMVTAVVENIESLQTIANLVIGVSCYDSNTRTFNKFSTNRFAINCCPEAYVYFMAMVQDADMCEIERYKGRALDNEIVMLNKGLNEVDGKLVGMIKSDYTGEVTIKKIKDKLYAVKPLDIDLPEVENNFVSLSSVDAEINKGDELCFWKRLKQKVADEERYEILVYKYEGTTAKQIAVTDVIAKLPVSNNIPLCLTQEEVANKTNVVVCEGLWNTKESFLTRTKEKVEKEFNVMYFSF